MLRICCAECSNRNNWIVHLQVMEVLAEGLICERASIDECYLDCTLAAEAQVAATGGLPAVPPADQLARIHVTGEVAIPNFLCSGRLDLESPHR